MSAKENKNTDADTKDIHMATSKAKVYKTRKFIRSNMTTRSLVDTVSYVKDKRDGSIGDYVVVYHNQHVDKAYKIKKKAVENTENN